MGTEVTIGVHERMDGEGYVVKLSALGRAARYPTDTMEEAVLLSLSFRDGIQAGIPLDVLLGDDTRGEST